MRGISITEQTGSDIIAAELRGDWRDPEATGWLFFLFDHSSRPVMFFEVIGSYETADQDTSNYAHVFINGHPLGSERERENSACFKKKTLMMQR